MRTWRATAAIVPPAVTVALLCVARHPRVYYTSDAVAQQSIVRTWLDAGHGTTALPPDTWILKIPIYEVIERLPWGPWGRLLAVVLTLNILTFVFAVIGALLLAPRARWYELALPLTWLAAIGGGIGSNRLLPNYRNVELGLYLLILGLIAVYLRRQEPVGWRSLWALPAAVLLAIYWYNDPYFLVLTGLPIAVLAVVWFVVRDQNPRLFVVAGTLAGSYLLYTHVIGWVGTQLGIQIIEGQQLTATGLSVWFGHLSWFFGGIMIQLGLDTWAGMPVYRWAAQILVGAGVVVGVAASIWLAVRSWVTRDLVAGFIGVQFLLVLAGVLSRPQHDSRYLILAIYSLTAAVVILLPELRCADQGGPAIRRSLARPVTWLFAAGAVVGLVANLTIYIQADHRTPEARILAQRQLVAAVRASGAVKGYASYWSSNISAYMAGKGYTSYELVCWEDTFRPRPWLTDTAGLDRPASTTFLVWVPADQAARGCNASMRDEWFGPATKTVTLPDGTQVLTYGYDIGSRLERS